MVLRQELADGVLTLALDRPAARNALDQALVALLTQAVQAPPARTRVILLRGHAPPFCAGADLQAMRRAAAGPPAENLADAAALGALFAAVDRSPVPVVAAVAGAAVGGGVGLVACCDVVVAAEDARFALTEARLGLAPAVIAPYVVDKIGLSWARRLMLSGQPVGAAQAAAMGLVHRVVAADALAAAAAAECAALAAAAPGATATIKAMLRDRRASGDPDAAADRAACLARLRAGPEGQEGLRAFFAKQPPSWA